MRNYLVLIRKIDKGRFTKRQIEYWLGVKRNGTNANRAPWTLSDFDDVYHSHSAIPDSVDECFVADCVTHCATESQPQFFVITFTTKRLVKLHGKSTIFHADGTYKTNRAGHPLIVTGVTDKARKFHPTSVSIANGETQQHFEVAFQSVKLAFK